MEVRGGWARPIQTDPGCGFDPSPLVGLKFFMSDPKPTGVEPSGPPHHVSRERLEAAGLGSAGERPLQDSSFEHVKEQPGVHVAVLTTRHARATRGRVTQLLHPRCTLLALCGRGRRETEGISHREFKKKKGMDGLSCLMTFIPETRDENVLHLSCWGV